MSQSYPISQNHTLRSLLMAASLTLPLTQGIGAQTPGEAAKPLPPATSQSSSLKASAYYHFSLGHLYEEMAAASNNRTDYVNKAIENFRLAMKEDPAAGFLVEDIAELYGASGRLREAVDEAQSALKANPNDLNARRVLARIYAQLISDTKSNRNDDSMARKALEQYKAITAADPKDVESWVMMGRLSLVLGSSVDAETAFKKAIEVEPENEDALTGLASVYSDRNDTKDASAILEKLAQTNPSPRAWVSLGQTYEQMKEYSMAADAFKHAIALDPSRVEVKTEMATDLAEAERYDEALKAYQELAEANPQDPEPLARMSQIYSQQRKLDDARQLMDKARAIDPDNIEIRYYDAHLLVNEGKLPEAVKELKDILDSTAKPSYDAGQKTSRARMLDELGVMYRQNDQPDQAVATFRDMASVDPDSKVQAEIQIIETYRIGKDYTKANQELDTALKNSPDDKRLIGVKAGVLADQGKTDPAIAELKKLLKGQKDADRDVYLQMADIYQQARDYTHMSDVLASADKLAADKDDKNKILFRRAAMHEREKKFDVAEQEFRKVLDADPKYAEAWNYLGYMLADQNLRLNEAQEDILKALSLDPENYAFLDSLGWVYYRENKLSDAENELSHSIRLWPKDPTIHDHLGDVLFKQGKIKDAIAQWQSSLKAWDQSAPVDVEPEEVAKVQKKLDNARVKLAEEQHSAN